MNYQQLHILFGIFGLLFYLYNWTRHAIFSTIRAKNVSRERKVKLAQLSKRVVLIHRWTGTSALIFVIIHLSFVIHLFGFQIHHIKFITGLLASLTMFTLVITGWIRLFKPTIAIRYIHLYLGLSLFFLIIIHLFV